MTTKTTFRPRDAACYRIFDGGSLQHLLEWRNSVESWRASFDGADEELMARLPRVGQLFTTEYKEYLIGRRGLDPLIFDEDTVEYVDSMVWQALQQEIRPEGVLQGDVVQLVNTDYADRVAQDQYRPRTIGDVASGLYIVLQRHVELITDQTQRRWFRRVLLPTLRQHGVTMELLNTSIAGFGDELESLSETDGVIQAVMTLARSPISANPLGGGRHNHARDHRRGDEHQARGRGSLRPHGHRPADRIPARGAGSGVPPPRSDAPTRSQAPGRNAVSGGLGSAARTDSGTLERRLCLNCQKPGHSARRCPDGVRCFHCGARGHKSSECRVAGSS